MHQKLLMQIFTTLSEQFILCMYIYKYNVYVFSLVVSSSTCQVIALRYMYCHQIKRSEIPSLHKMFLLHKQVIEVENGLTDATVLTLHHGTKPRNVLEIASEGFNRNYGKSGIALYIAARHVTALLQLLYKNINYCVRGGHKPARWPWPTSRLTEMEK